MVVHEYLTQHHVQKHEKYHNFLIYILFLYLLLSCRAELSAPRLSPPFSLFFALSPYILTIYTYQKPPNHCIMGVNSPPFVLYYPQKLPPYFCIIPLHSLSRPVLWGSTDPIFFTSFVTPFVTPIVTPIVFFASKSTLFPTSVRTQKKGSESPFQMPSKPRLTLV